MVRSVPRELKPSHAQVRACRRQLADKIRDDWSYVDPRHPSGTEKTSVPLAQLLSADHAAPSDASDETQSAQDHGHLQDPYTIDEARVLSWKEPYYASSDPSSDEKPDNEALNITTAKTGDSSRLSPSNNSSIGDRLKRQSLRLIGVNVDKGYERELESEDATHSDDQKGDGGLFTANSTSQALALQRRKHERKMRRRQRFEHEMSWNEGLRHWERRREAWCCAKTVRMKPSQEFPVEGDTSDEQSEEDETSDEHDVSDESRRLPASLHPPSLRDKTLSRSSSQSSALSLRRHNAHLPEDSKARHKRQPGSRNLDRRVQTPLLPVAAPLLPTSDPTRASMSPALYSSIYSKVVIQSLTPAVPINMTHLIPALVNGWKADGEWPPTSAPEPAPTRANVRKSLTRTTPRRKPAEKIADVASKRNSVSRPLSWVLPSSSNHAHNASRAEPPPEQLKVPLEGPKRDSRDLSPPKRSSGEKDPRTRLTPDAANHQTNRTSSDTQPRRHSRASRPLSWLVDTFSIDPHKPDNRPNRRSISTSTKQSSHSSKGSLDREKPLPVPPAAPATPAPLLDKETHASHARGSSTSSSPSPASAGSGTSQPRQRHRQRPLSSIFSRDRDRDPPTPSMRTGLSPASPPPPAQRPQLDENGDRDAKTDDHAPAREDGRRRSSGLRGVGGRIRKRLSAGEWSLASAA